MNNEVDKHNTIQEKHILPKNPFLRILAIVFGFLGGIAYLGTVGVIAIAIVYLGVASYVTAYPRSKTLAHRYLNAIIQADAKAAMRLVVDTDPYVMPCYEQDILLDIIEYGHARVRNLHLELYGPFGSDDSVQTVNLRFQYLKPGQSEWQNGEFSIMTDAVNLIKRRILMVHHKDHMLYLEISGKCGPPEPVK
jgi:hypothetical protein